MASTQGKIEIETLDEREGSVVEKLFKAATLTVFRDQVKIEDLKKRDRCVRSRPRRPRRRRSEFRPTTPSALNQADAEPLREAVRKLVGAKPTAAEQASALEFILEGLHLSKRLNKDAAGTKSTYRGR